MKTFKELLAKKTFTVSVDPNTIDWEEFNDTMNEYHSKIIEQTKKEAEKLGVKLDTAYDIIYLRGRSRWTQEKEDYLISLDKAGKELPPCYEAWDITNE